MKQEKLILLAGGGAVAGLLAYAVYKKSADASQTASGTWKPVPDRTLRGGTYRISSAKISNPTQEQISAIMAVDAATVAQGMTSDKITFFAFPNLPADWPADDRSDPTRTRGQFTGPPTLNPPIAFPGTAIIPDMKMWHLE